MQIDVTIQAEEFDGILSVQRDGTDVSMFIDNVSDMSGTTLAWFAVTADQAEEIGNAMVRAARAARKARQGAECGPAVNLL